ncbi:DNA-binding transcriptional MerR regulator [Peribacillus deserti]|uniref:DNA-binding transcriptional MerR regulator n=1 Tax=Peribacillus deserti TaxID=673318 RepID=A0ABS2QJ34_9BACI|nr:MerR family transcriptional regulator [Peribacillus deserti]MBM7692749.1 DNA-binding transcriptional MerR regulator [Peribacillus deserti]
MKTTREVAQLFQVSSRTLRYYEELGLLKPARSEVNQRLFSKADCTRLKLILRGKRFGFTLEEIKEMVLLFDKDRTGKKQLERTIKFGTEKIEEVEGKIKELQEMKEEMEILLLEFTEKLDK